MNRFKLMIMGPYMHDMGGVTTHIRKLTECLSKIENIEVHIITIDNVKTDYIENDIYFHIIKKPFPYPLAIPFLVRRILSKINEVSPDIIHVQSTILSYSTAAAMAAKTYPTLLTIHGLKSDEMKFNHKYFLLQDLISRFNEKYALSKIPNIIVCSPQMEIRVKRFTNSEISIIPNGIDMKDVDKHYDVIRMNSPSLLYVGALSRIKGVDILLNALPIIIEVFPNLCLYIIGSGSEENYLKRLVLKLGIENHVTFIGHLDSDNIFPYYMSCDLFVLPSRYESFGIVLLEAMSCGKPVISADVGGIPSIILDGINGVLFRSDDSNDLAETAISLLKNKKRLMKMGSLCKKTAKEFSWDQISKETVSVYMSIMDKFNGRTI